KGINALGKCNHVTALLFALEDFCRKGLHENEDPVSCTSTLCQWTKPRTLQTTSAPLHDLTIRKYQYSQDYNKKPSINLYDPRAPHQRHTDGENVQVLCQSFQESVGQSSLFLFHDVQPLHGKAKQAVKASDIIEDQGYELPTENIVNFNTESQDSVPSNSALPFSDEYNINTSHFHEIVKFVASRNAKSLSEDNIKAIEKQTRGQAGNIAWQNIRRMKMTASNFGKFVKRRCEPDKLLHSLLYRPSFSTYATEYGRKHVADGVNAYLSYKHENGSPELQVQEVGFTICRHNTDYGASLDRMVTDPTEAVHTVGGLEVKCPPSFLNMSPEDAAKEKNSFLSLNNGVIMLKRSHNYYIQVQGQMYAAGLQWVDFVVWFGEGCNIFVQRIKFNEDLWYSYFLPALNHFYFRAFLPEILTSRVKRGIKLYRHGGWKPYRK
ncbi:uncharacterized protein LOC144356967, partial [Saccoglossus kowalevskii]